MIVQSGLRNPIEVTYIETGLFVQASIYDLTTGTPVFVGTVNLMEITPGTYVGTMIGAAAKAYLVVKRVFTDNTYAVVDSNFSPSSEAFQAVDLSGGGGGTPGSTGSLFELIAIVGDAPIIGLVDDNPITGTVEIV